MNKRFQILLQSFAVAAFLLPVGAPGGHGPRHGDGWLRIGRRAG